MLNANKSQSFDYQWMANLDLEKFALKSFLKKTNSYFSINLLLKLYVYNILTKHAIKLIN